MFHKNSSSPESPEKLPDHEKNLSSEEVFVKAPPSSESSTSPTVAPARSFQEEAVLNEEALAREMMEEDKMSLMQKITLFIIGLLVVGSLGFGGFWLYRSVSNGNNVSGGKTNSSNFNKNSSTIINADQSANQSSSDNTNAVNNPLDLDNDSLTNAEEVLYGTDPRDADTDNDAYNDGQEVQSGYNPKGAGRL